LLLERNETNTCGAFDADGNLAFLEVDERQGEIAAAVFLAHIIVALGQIINGSTNSNAHTHSYLFSLFIYYAIRNKQNSKTQ